MSSFSVYFLQLRKYQFHTLYYIFLLFSSLNPLVPFGTLPTVWAFHINFFLQLFFCSFHCFLQLLFISFSSLINLETCSNSLLFALFSFEPKISQLFCQHIDIPPRGGAGDAFSILYTMRVSVASFRAYLAKQNLRRV